MNGISGESRIFVYRITPDDVIESVNDAWVQFAVDNDSPKLPQEVIGSSLWKYVSGQEVVHLSKELLTKVRESRCEVTIPFRCDSPLVQRFMQMTILPLGQGKVEFRTWIEREEPYANPIHLLDAAFPQNQNLLLRMCSWCKKIGVEDAWLNIEDGIRQLRLFDLPTISAITHVVCDCCYEKLATELNPRRYES